MSRDRSIAHQEAHSLRSLSFLPAVALGCALTCAAALKARGQEVQTPSAPPNANQPAVKPAPSPTPRRAPTELQKAVNEFRVQMGQLNSGGGKMKGGGRQNAFTGRVYEYLRNDLLDALPHEVRQRGGTKSLLRRNQYGFNLNGPLWLPRVYDGRRRTFFSVSYEATRERIAQGALFTVPTAKQRLGDFSDLVDTAGQPVKIYDPATTRPNPNYDPQKPVAADNLQYLRDPFPNNVIPTERLDAVSRALLRMYPQPNTNVGPFLQNNYWVNSPFENRAGGVIAKLDHTHAEKHQLSFNVTTSSGLRKSPEYFPGPANSGAPSYSYENRSAAVSDSFTASPQVVWNFRLSANHNLTSSLDADAQGQDYPRQIGLGGVLDKSFPRFSFGNYLSIGPRTTAIFRESNYTYNGLASVSINRKAHTLKLTAQAMRRYVNSLSPWAPAGFFLFNNGLTGQPGVRNTGNAFASFLLGLSSRAEESVVLNPSYYRKNFVDLNVMDEYRVRPGVTASFSLSLEVSTPRVEKYDRQSTVSFDRVNPANGRPGALIFAGRDGVGRALQPVTARLEPSIGLAVNPWNDRKTVLRLNYSLSYQDYPLVGRHFGTQGFNSYFVFPSPNDQLEPAVTLQGGLPQNVALPPQLTPDAANGTDADYVDPSGLLPANQQWSLSVQRELPGSLAVEASYRHWRGTHQWVDDLVRLNAVPVSALSYGEQLYDDDFRNSLRPYPQFRNLELGGYYPGGDEQGDSLTVTVDKRLSAGLYGRAVYRFAKQIDNTSSFGAQNPHDLDAEMSLSTDDIAHSLQLSYTYELPFGKGKPFVNDDDWLGRVLGGWSLSGLTTVRGGAPLRIVPYFNRTGGIVSSLRVNVVPGVDAHVENPSADQWFNPAAFAQPDDFTLGNASRTHPSLRSPGEQFHHLSMTKRIPVYQDTSLEFVAESFNFPNHANLNDPDTRIGPASSPNLNAGKIIGSTGGRVMQLGLRVLF
jgi:hypothetical protein